MKGLYLQVNIRDNITPITKKAKQQLNNLPDEAYKVFVKETPVRSGNARRNTKLNGKKINAEYPYANRLDQGYSKQSPDGMIKPTEEFIRKRFRDIMKGL